MNTRVGHAALTVSGTATLNVPGSILAFAVAIGSSPGPIALTSTSAPSFQRPAWIDAADSSATTVSLLPAAATYGTNGRFARSRIVSAASRGVSAAAD